MKTLHKLIFIALVAVGACNAPVEAPVVETPAPTEKDSLALQLHEIADSKVLPGFAISVFTKDSILYQEGFGVSNLEHQTPFRAEDVQIIASCTKTLVGVGLMKAVEDGLLQLDDDINDLLPFRVVNPNFPDSTITVRMLASHTSTITGTEESDKGYRFQTPLLASDFPPVYEAILAKYNHTEDLAMSAFLENKLSADGIWYESELFINEAPGTTYEYSNLGITLLAYILELKTNLTFAEYTQNLILQPLGMKASTWNLNDVPDESHVTYYNEVYHEVPRYHIISYPDGGLYSSVSDMTLFVQEMMKGLDGHSDLMTQASFQEMTRKQFEGEELYDALCWDLSFEGLVGHAGNDFGTATLMYFSPESGVGRILFTNISIETEEQEEAFYGIFNRLFEYDLRSK